MAPLQEYLVNSVLAVAILIVSRFLWNYLRSPVKAFPGPWPASFTNGWRFLETWQGRCELTHLDLHRKLGPAVRIGPNILSLSDPQMINQVYTARNPWMKSDQYNVNDVVIDGVRVKNLFSHQDEKWHSRFLRPIKGLYSMTRVQDNEAAVDVVVTSFIEKIRERFIKSGNTCEMADYITYLAWDVMGQVTFSKDLGILEAGYDLQKIIETSSKVLDYFAPVSQIPKLDMLFDKNPIYRVGPPGFGWATFFAIEQYQKRLAAGAPTEGRDPDFMDRFIELKEKFPDTVDDNMIIGYMLVNIVAGSDTTASTMCAAVYYILKHPSVAQKLRQELRSTSLSMPAQWKEIQALPYLDAVMRETMRIAPGVSMLMERIVPEEGFTLPDGRFVAGGTTVGMNPYVVNRDASIFGADTESFIPERWLRSDKESEDEHQARVSKMKGVDLSFGAGPRTCLGRHLSMLESYKVIATMFNEFDMELPSPNHEWKVINSWFVRQENIPVSIKEASR